MLYRHLGALPDAELGTINLLPFSVDNEQTNAIKRKVCEAIVGVLRDSGYAMTRESAPRDVTASRHITVSCRSCSTTLLATQADQNGVANVAAPTLIAGMARLHPECPHAVITPEDQRRAIEEAALVERAAAEGGA